jgi:hypothetical protein
MQRRKPLQVRAFLSVAAAACLALVCGGCPKIPKRIPGTSGDSKLRVSVHISEKANNGNPVALDLVMVADKKLLEKLREMTAEEWFKSREQIKLDFPKKGQVEVKSWEWVPDQRVSVNEIIVPAEIRGGIVFANYFKPGAHRAVFNPRKHFTIKLGQEKLEIETLKN